MKCVTHFSIVNAKSIYHFLNIDFSKLGKNGYYLTEVRALDVGRSLEKIGVIYSELATYSDASPLPYLDTDTL